MQRVEENTQRKEQQQIFIEEKKHGNVSNTDELLKYRRLKTEETMNAEE